MAPVVRAKLLLGWMSENDALRALNSCYFEKPLSHRDCIKLWRSYRDKVQALPLRRPGELPRLEMTETEKAAVAAHKARIQAGPNARYLADVIKVHPSDLIAHQLEVITEHSEMYGQEMKCETTRLNHFLGIGMDFNGQLVPRRISRRVIDVDLPHFEFVPRITPQGIEFKERDRHVMAVPSPNGNLVLWGGYHRTHAILCQLAGEAAAVAPLLTIMRGIGEVDSFFAKATPLRDSVLGERPALLRDFLDEELFIAVNLRKMRAVGRIEELKPGKCRVAVVKVAADT